MFTTEELSWINRSTQQPSAYLAAMINQNRPGAGVTVEDVDKHRDRRSDSLARYEAELRERGLL